MLLCHGNRKITKTQNDFHKATLNQIVYIAPKIHVTDICPMARSYVAKLYVSGSSVTAQFLITCAYGQYSNIILEFPLLTIALVTIISLVSYLVDTENPCARNKPSV